MDVLEDPLEREKVSTKVNQSPIIIYRRNQENPSPNKENEKKKYKEDELPTLYISKSPFTAALEANTQFMFTKKGVRMDEMRKLFKQVQINCPLLDVIKQVSSYDKFLKDLCTQKRRLKTQIPKKSYSPSR